MALARKTAADSGRDPAALEYTRRGASDLTAERVDELAGHGVTRLVVNFMAPDAGRQHDRMSEFAERFGLASG
ncbi:hypothetical protein [Nocardia wallacei]|uniref:hypothetical protein n=1 Tax=Nocardia wallacei TaxID=480035 RepID=UPI002457A965|nr:hypothetical protein [Nocardia wallacei]